MGQAKLQAMVDAIPAGADNIAVTIVGVSVSLDTFDANIELARDRAKRIASFLEDAGVSGTYTVSVSTTFTVDAAERQSRSLDSTSRSVPLQTPEESSSGKPLTTATITFDAPSEAT